MASRFLDEQARRLPGCTHHPDAPHRPYCPCVLDVEEMEAAAAALTCDRCDVPMVAVVRLGEELAECPRCGAMADVKADEHEAAADPIDTYDPDDRLPVAGDPYWSEDR
jgi:hypothetical protein